ncbi:MAG: twin-arginine translocase TatA/TatE family subunit [Candidatus Limnocylindrus sp.]
MPNIGPGELILILAVILVVFGPGKLPEIGAAVGRSFREFRKATSEAVEPAEGRSATKSPARRPKRKV